MVARKIENTRFSACAPLCCASNTSRSSRFTAADNHFRRLCCNLMFSRCDCSVRSVSYAVFGSSSTGDARRCESTGPYIASRPVMTTSDNVLEVYRYAFDCSRSGDEAWLAAFVEAGGSADLTNDNGDTLLILATYHVRVEAASVLLAAGADVERVNDNGQTALAAAVFRRSRELVELLLKAGANPDTGARSAATIATFFGLDDMAELLTEHR